MSKKESFENQTPEFDKSMFEYVSSKDEFIHDEALKTKPTTFAKDALKRFAKNKSSVVGAIIIGILLLGSFTLPYITGHDIKTPHADLSLMTPKLFKAGTGFWDGTTMRNNIPWDGSVENPDGTTGAPGDIPMSAVVPGTLKIEDVSYIDQYYKYAAGGYLRITSDILTPDEQKQQEEIFFLRNYTSFSFTKNDEVTLTIEFGDTPTVNGDIICPHRVGLECISPLTGEYGVIPLCDWTNDTHFSMNLSDFIYDQGIFEINDVNIMIEGLPNISPDKYSYFLVKTVDLTTNVTDEETVLLFNKISIDNANYTAGKGLEHVYEKDMDYWQSTGVKNVYRAEKRMVSFRFDKYAYVLGDRYDFTIGGSIMKQYIEKGWCEFTNFNDPDTFTLLDKRCPVKEVFESSYDSSYDVYQFKTHTVYYQYLGYKTMPVYLLGTTANGYDLLTLGMSCLKTSLLIAIISSAICLAIGLVWGSISGYFGGTVDIVMERITDVISGVPWIVMMTLIILLLGQNAVTFCIALVMTGWIGTATRTRMQFYRFKRREYVLASRTLGASDWRLIFRHILPNGLGTIVTGSVLMIPGCIFSEATISYLGLGLKGMDSFGVLLSSNQQYLNSYPVLVVFPAIVISLLMISFNLFGNGLRDALNPTLKGGEQ